jgi:ABC-type branched-subunit amino acid transport system ATPase component
MSGFLRPDSGQVMFDGQDITGRHRTSMRRPA